MVCILGQMLRFSSLTPFSILTAVLPPQTENIFHHCSCGSVSVGGRRQWHPTPVRLPGKSHGWRSLVGCSPWGCKESDTTEQLHFHFSLSCVREGNGNPLVFLPGESQGRGSLVGCHLWGHTESDMTEVTEQQQQGKPQGHSSPK